MSDPYAPLKDNAWREAAALDDRFATGEIDEEQWHAEWQAIAAPAYLGRLLEWSERLIIGVFNEHESERTAEELLGSWGFAGAGRSVRPNRRKPGMEYPVVGIDA